MHPIYHITVYCTVCIHLPPFMYALMHTCTIMEAIQIPAAARHTPTQTMSSVASPLLIRNLPAILTCYWLV